MVLSENFIEGEGEGEGAQGHLVEDEGLVVKGLDLHVVAQEHRRGVVGNSVVVENWEVMVVLLVA